MRPIKLTMSAFGPFVDVESINFESLGKYPLFLINGATGSGKTTILDAICYALYGQMTGSDREAIQMRCDYADTKTLTQVEFIFELANQHYRVLRIPEQQRAKLKGDGVTRQEAKAELWQQNKDTESLLVPQKVKEVTKRIEILTGLQVDQFRQVMVLPQDQFRRLLMADSKEREEIFSQLFETHIYKRIEDKLKAHAKQVAQKVKKNTENQKGILQSVEFEKVDDLQQAIADVTPTCELLATEKATKEQQFLGFIKSLEVAQSLAKSFQRLAQLQQKMSVLEAQKEIIDEKKNTFMCAQFAQKIAPFFSDLQRCKAELKATFGLQTQAQKTLSEVQKQFIKVTDTLNENTQRQKQMDDEKKNLVKLQSYGERVKQLKEANKIFKGKLSQFKKSQQTWQKVNQKRQSIKSQLDLMDAQKRTLEHNLQKASTLGSEYEKLKEQRDRKKNYSLLLARKINTEKERQQVTEKGIDLKKELEKKQQQANQLEIDWHRGQAAVLASQLKKDQACPVCGSKNHPKLGSHKQHTPTKEEREEAQHLVEKWQQMTQTERDKYTDLSAQINSYIEQINTLQKNLGHLMNSSLEQLDQQFKLLTEQVRLNQQKHQQFEKLGQQIGLLKIQQQKNNQEWEVTSQLQDTHNTELETAKAIVLRAEEELPKTFRVTSKLASEMKKTEQQIIQLRKEIDDTQKNYNDCIKLNAKSKEKCEGLHLLIDNHETATIRATNLWEKTLKDSRFNDLADFQKATDAVAELALLQQQIKTYDNQYQKAKGALLDQQQSLAEKQKPDIKALEKEIAQVKKQKEIIDQQWKVLDTNLSHYKKALNTLQLLLEKQQQAETEYQLIGTLSDVANGQTGNKISLQRFVLSVLLDEVLIEASQRLTEMSKGRYRLLRKLNKAKGNKASGLELEVEDNYTGKSRAVSTLSGGESFIASLALALGLSSVVQARAGGIRLDTLFIDEGFGSLDTDSLDLAIRTLIDLRDTGRMVGIISHVSELKDQINLRIDVIAGRKGSIVKIVH